MNDFLPKGYEVPTAETGYMRWEEGENKFRILASPILGYEAWNEVKGEDGKKKRAPLRFRMEAQIPIDELDEPEKVKHFWAMPVWNYSLKRVQILEITQKGIQRTLRALAKDKEWGSPLGYDVSVVRSGQTIQDTEYETIPSPPKPLAKEIKEAYERATINLEALFDGENPFESEITDKDLGEVEA